MRIILRCDRYTRIDDMLTKLQWMNMKQVIEYNALVFIHQIKLGLMPPYFEEALIDCSSVHNYNTRNKESYYVKCFKKSTACNSVFSKGIITYNHLSSSIKNNNSEMFKVMLKRYYLSKYL